MERKYGKEQKDTIEKIKRDLVKSIESIYLRTFEDLNDQGLGDGAIIKLTQLLLISKQAAISVIKEERNN
tara:strand:- start:832 stop:1041 length:210 start_codon:yes stop_codon:yes gene_type:complete